MPVKFLCPECEHGKFHRVVKYNGIPCESEYLCVRDRKKTDILDDNVGPGGWDPKVGCTNFILRTQDDNEWVTITSSDGMTRTVNFRK